LCLAVNRKREKATVSQQKEEEMFGGRLGVPELIIILGIALLFFGPSKLGGLGKGIGDAIRNFKGAMKDGETTPAGQSTQPAEQSK